MLSFLISLRQIENRASLPYNSKISKYAKYEENLTSEFKYLGQTFNESIHFGTRYISSDITFVLNCERRINGFQEIAYIKTKYYIYLHWFQLDNVEIKLVQHFGLWRYTSTVYKQRILGWIYLRRNEATLKIWAICLMRLIVSLLYLRIHATYALKV